MRTTEIIATIAVAGAVATFALLNMNGVQTGNTFLATQITEAEREFINFIAQHGRSYGTKEEYEYRLSLFAQVFEDVRSHNADGETFTKVINKFSDFSDYEWKKMQGYNPSTRQADSAPTYTYLSEVGAPASVDWRNSGAVTGVKNQGSCGSCWSFSTTGSIEGINKIKTGSLISLSEQQFVDCDRSYGDLGCSGGLPENAFQYAKANKIETEAAYPYTGVRATCAYVASKGQVQLKGQGAVTKNSPSQLLAAVATQPVSVGIEADKAVFQSYGSGIITSTACGISMDHAVLVVGYGTEGGQDYWLLKNSWGVTWGEKGYFRLGRSTATGAGICGLQQDATYPTL